jgi:DNA-binding transcriptional MerR regulator
MIEDGLVAIGELARRAGVATSALRYYDRLGLVSSATRAGGKRYYAAASAERVALIRLYQDAGFTLNEIGELLASWDRGQRDLGHVAERKITELDGRIEDAQRAKKLLEHALACPYPDLLACPSFRAELEARLDRPGPEAHAREDAPSSAARARP